MKDYEMKRIKYYIKLKERESRAIVKMINHLLPSSVQELNECIAINNMLDNDC